MKHIRLARRLAAPRPVVLGMGIVALVLVAGCAASRGPTIPPPVPDDRHDISPPKKRKVYEVPDLFDQQVARPTRRWFDLSRLIRRVGDAPKEAFNVDAFDAVPNSSWFTNRIGHRQLTPAQIRRGPDRHDGPDLSGTWRIVAAKNEGVTPGFTIQDPRGDRYVIKFDTRGFPELSTGAEIVSTKLLWAAGYNTPENYLVRFHPEILEIGDEVMIEDPTGRRYAMEQHDLDALLGRVERDADGAFRAVASRYLEGKILGPFRYHRTRSDDPNDFVPHEHRRELRGLRLVSAWMNNYDIKANNTLDVYVEDGGRRYVRHYLIDFGSSLGSQGENPMPVWVGHENSIDPGQMFLNAIGLGFYVPPWEKNRAIRYASVGRFDDTTFEPEAYQFTTPNPAFENMTVRDALWAARIVTGFGDDQLRAAVDAGEYSDPAAADYLARTLASRRDIIARHWFGRYNSLDRFGITGSADGGYALSFMDHAVRSGIIAPVKQRYRYTVWQDGDELLPPVEVPMATALPLPTVSAGMMEVKVEHRRAGQGWTRPVSAWIRVSTNPGSYQVVAVERHD